jgi:methylmalonyl-CoA mutase cobalamin-binding subunit
MTISNQDFAAAKKAVKKVGTADVSLAHKTAMQVLADRCKSAGAELIQEMGWQVVLAAR